MQFNQTLTCINSIYHIFSINEIIKTNVINNTIERFKRWKPNFQKFKRSRKEESEDDIYKIVSCYWHNTKTIPYILYFFMPILCGLYQVTIFYISYYSKLVIVLLFP